MKSCNIVMVYHIYKHCIVAKYKLGWEMLSKSNESFFEEIFDKKEPEPKSKLLKFQEFNKIVEIYLDLSEKVYNVKSEETFLRRAHSVENWINWILELVED